MILYTPECFIGKNPKEIQFYFILNQSLNATKKHCIIIVNNHQNKIYAAFLYPQKKRDKTFTFYPWFSVYYRGTLWRTLWRKIRLPFRSQTSLLPEATENQAAIG